MRLFAEGHTAVAGVDEVGRGSWAGPVVAAAVVLPSDVEILRLLAGLRDSKQLAPPLRLELAGRVCQCALSVGLGWASHHAIDRDGIAAANRRAMVRAVANLKTAPTALLIDHFRLPESPLPQVCITRGDSLSLSIAAASVVAKVLRDRWMSGCDPRFPGYGFARHKGYGTPEHRRALQELGPCPLHRRSFAPVGLLSQ